MSNVLRKKNGKKIQEYGLLMLTLAIILFIGTEMEIPIGIMFAGKKASLYLLLYACFVLCLLLNRVQTIPLNTVLKLLCIQFLYYLCVTLICMLCGISNQSVLANFVNLVMPLFAYEVAQVKDYNIEILEKLSTIIVTAILIQLIAVYVNNMRMGYSISGFKSHIILPVGKSNAIASILLVCFAILLNSYKRKLMAIVSFVCVVLTLSNSGLIAAIACLVFYLVKKKRIGVGILKYVAIVAGLVFVASFLLQRLSFGSQLEGYLLRFQRSVEIMINPNSTFEKVTNGRDVLWSSAWELIKSKPIFGYGVGDVQLGTNIIGKTHNVILQALLWGGLFGLVILILVLFESYQKLGRGYSRLVGQCILVCTLIQAMAEPTFFTGAFDFFFWFAMGTLNGSCTNYQYRNSVQSE